MQHMQFIA